ncbi:MAG TPA: DNA mismatch repair protein [Polyangiaceae bacterium]|nr:DNA mismatch repair protein [Polyangiaceae bacterium]
MASQTADLLHPEPRLWLDEAALQQALTFAFAAGSTGEDFDRLLNAAKLAPSRFRSDSFARDLFVSDVVQKCMVIRVKKRERNYHRGLLIRCLCQPPIDLDTVVFRQGVLRELEQRPELRTAMERSWLQIQELISRLEAGERGKRYDVIARRVDILRDVKHAIELLHDGFSHATSGLARAAQFATQVRDSKSYRDLLAVLDHESHLATVELRVRLAHDGGLRGFEITSARENRENPFHVAPLQRFLTRLRFFFRGYRVREAEILGRLINQVFDGVQSAVIGLFQIGLHFEFYLAALALKARAAELGLQMCLPEIVQRGHADSETRLEALFNPLLLLEGKAPIPCTLEVGPSALTIITGPNSGGKTRLLEALGLSQLLGQAGMFVPAARARLAFRDGLFVSLIQVASAEHQEGRLGTELRRIRHTFEELDVNSLVILDELCSGTNPSEGEGIFELVVSLLCELEPQAFITTHFLEFAARLARDRPVRNLEFLQVELDARSEPTYRFVTGVARTSLAGKTAERLGVTREALTALVREKRRTLSTPPADPDQEAAAAAIPKL